MVHLHQAANKPTLVAYIIEVFEVYFFAAVKTLKKWKFLACMRFRAVVGAYIRKQSSLRGTFGALVIIEPVCITWLVSTSRA